MPLRNTVVTLESRVRPSWRRRFDEALILDFEDNPLIDKDVVHRYTVYDLTTASQHYPTDTKVYNALQVFFGQPGHPQYVQIFSTSRSATPVVTDMSDALLAAWEYDEQHQLPVPFFVINTGREEVDGDISELDDQAAAMEMVYLAHMPYTATPAEIQAEAVNLNSRNTVLLCHDSSTEQWFDAALTSYWAGSVVGAITLVDTPLNGVAAASYTKADIFNVIHGQQPGGNGGFTYFRDSDGFTITSGSWATDGTFADLVRQQYWLAKRIQEDIHWYQVNHGKIPFDDRGRDILYKIIYHRMLDASSAHPMVAIVKGIPMFEIRIPEIGEPGLDDINRARRTVDNVEVEYEPSGAMEWINIRLIMSFDLS